MADVGDRHRDHDPVLVASLLDGDLGDAERSTAVARIDSCSDCAALYADLRALAMATRARPAPARQRDFRLTAADAARLRAEPAAPGRRLTGVLTGPSTASSHLTHDTILVASLADHSLDSSERAAAEALVASCGECAALQADLVTLVAATRAMPTPRRPRVFTLTPDDAERLRGSWWRRLVGVIGSSRDGFSRPLAVGLSTLGLIGILVASAPTVLQIPGGLSDSATSQNDRASRLIDAAASSTTSDTSGVAAPGAALAPTSGGAAAAPSTAPDRAAISPAPVYGVTVQPHPAASARPQIDSSGKGAGTGVVVPSPQDLGSTPNVAHVAKSSGPDPLLLISAAFLVVGLGLFILRWSARRLSDG